MSEEIIIQKHRQNSVERALRGEYGFRMKDLAAAYLALREEHSKLVEWAEKRGSHLKLVITCDTGLYKKWEIMLAKKELSELEAIMKDPK